MLERMQLFNLLFLVSVPKYISTDIVTVVLQE